MTTAQKPLVEKVHDKLAAIINDGVDVHRCSAATAVGKIAHSGAGEVLKKALLDEDEDVRTDVVTALSKLQDPATAEAVMENFVGDPCPEVKMAAIETLVKLKHQPIIPHLMKLATARDEDITWDEDAFYDGGWDDWLDVQFAAITALGELGVVDGVASIVEAMHDDLGQDVSHIAIPALMKLAKPGADALDKLLREGDSRMRRRICDELQPGASKFMDGILDKCLKDDNAEVREIAISKLIEFLPNDKRLLASFEDANAEIRAIVVSAVGDKYPEQIMIRLKDKSPKVRQVAFRVITDNPNRFAKEGFSDIVTEAIAGNPDVGGEATVAWAALLGDDSATSLGEALQNTKQPQPFRLGLVEALSLLGDAGYSYLAKAAGDENRQVRINALTALGEMSKQTPWPNLAGETLLAALKGQLVLPPEEDEETEEEAVLAEEPEATEPVDKTREAAEEASVDLEEVGGVSEAAAVSTLDQLMSKGLRTEAEPDADYEEEEVTLSEQDERFIELSKQRAMRKKKIALDVKVAPHKDVRRFSARLFSDILEPGVVATLVEALEVEDDDLKLAVLDSLACLGELGKGLEDIALEPVLDEVMLGEMAIRRLAVRCLGWIDGVQAKDQLMALIGDANLHVRQEAIRSLGVKGETREVLVEALKDDYSGVRMTAAKALAARPDAETIRQLVTLSLGFDGMHRYDLVKLLRKLDVAEAGELYLKVLEDEDSKRVWRVAIETLGELFSESGQTPVSLAA